MGNTCCFCLQRKRSMDDLLDGSLEDKLLGKPDDVIEATTAEEEAWRQRREQLKGEEDMSMQSLDDDDRDSSRTLGAWDVIDRNTPAMIRKEATNFVEDDEDEKVFGSAEESADDDEEYQETNEHGANDDEVDFNRLTHFVARDSYASNLNSFREEDAQVLRDMEIDYNADTISATYLASVSTSTLRELEGVQGQEQQKQGQEDPVEEENKTEKLPGSSSSVRTRIAKKKSRSKKSMHK